MLPIKPNLVDVSMKRKESFPVEKSVASPTQDINQYNALIRYLVENKFGVAATSLCSYENFFNLFSKFLWSVDAHYAKLNARALNFPGSIKGVLNYNNPDKHKHSAPKFNSQYFQQKMSEILLHLGRRYTKSSHMTPLCKIVLGVFEKASMYIECLAAQKEMVNKCHRGYNNWGTY